MKSCGGKHLKTSDTFSSDSCEPGEMEVEEFEKEVRIPKQSTFLAAAEKILSIDNVIDVSKYGDMLRLLRVTSYVQRFVQNLKNKKEKVELCLTKYPTAEEMMNARELWVRANQLTLKE